MLVLGIQPISGAYIELSGPRPSFTTYTSPGTELIPIVYILLLRTRHTFIVYT